jgi:hypothetical protein
MSIVNGVFVTPQRPTGTKPVRQGMLTVGQPADPHFRQYTDAVPVTLLRAYRFSWRGERTYLRKGEQVYLLSWPDGTYRLVESPRSMHHFDESPTEGVDFTF